MTRTHRASPYSLNSTQKASLAYRIGLAAQCKLINDSGGGLVEGLTLGWAMQYLPAAAQREMFYFRDSLKSVQRLMALAATAEHIDLERPL